jgi:putative SOS response-associated peptidase YedK
MRCRSDKARWRTKKRTAAAGSRRGAARPTGSIDQRWQMARYNVCPTTTIDTIVERDAKCELVRMLWGLEPSWWSKSLTELRLATFNAHAETCCRATRG